jgi:hypothetical protein
MAPLLLGGLMAGGQAIGGIAGAIASNAASKRQVAAADKAMGAISTSYDKAQGYQQPYATAGLQGLGQLQNNNYNVATPGIYQPGEQQPQYQADQFNYQQSPGYNFALQQGQNAVTTSAAGRGAALSGATLKALSKFGTGLAQQDYGNEFNRYMQGRQQNAAEYNTQLGQYNTNRTFGAGQQQQDYLNRNQQSTQGYGRAFDLAGIGQSAANNLGTMATNYGDSLAGLYGQRGNAQAAGIMGVGQGINQIGQGISSGMNLAGLYQNNLDVANIKK